MYISIYINSLYIHIILFERNVVTVIVDDIYGGKQTIMPTTVLFYYL